MGDKVNMNGVDLSKFRNLNELSIKKEEFSNSKFFSIFNNGGVIHGDQVLDGSEISNIVEKLKATDADGNGEITAQELRQSDLVKELRNLYKGVKPADIIEFANELLGKVKVAQQAEIAAVAKERQEAIDAQNQFINQLEEVGTFEVEGETKTFTEEEKASFQDKLDALKAELAKSEPDLAKVAELRTALDTAINNIKEQHTAEAVAKREADEAAAELANQRQNNVDARPEKDPKLNGKRAYRDSSNRLGGGYWKNSVAGMFGEEEGKLNIKDFTDAAGVLDAILATDAYKDVQLSDNAKALLLKDFIHNNKSMFNPDGKIHSGADVSRMELPKSAHLKAANYNNPAKLQQPQSSLRSKASIAKQQQAALAKAYNDVDFEATDDASKKALDAKVLADVKAGNVPGYYLAPDGKTIMNSADNKPVEISTVIDAIKGYVSTAKSEAAAAANKPKEAALAKAYNGVDFDATDDASKKALDAKVLADVKAGNVPGYYLAPDGKTIMNSADNKPVEISTVINAIKGYVSTAKTEAAAATNKPKEAALAKAYNGVDFDATDDASKKALDAKVLADVKAGNVPGYYLAPDGKTIMNSADNKPVEISTVIDAIKGYVSTAKTATNNQKQAALAKAYNGVDFEATDDASKKALEAKVLADVKAGKVPGHYLAPDGKTIMNSADNSTVAISTVIDAIKGYVKAFHDGEYD